MRSKNKLSFLCHIYAELKNEKKEATIQRAFELLKRGNFEVRTPDGNFHGDGPVIYIKEV